MKKILPSFLFLSLILVLFSSLPRNQSKILKNSKNQNNKYNNFINFILEGKGFVKHMEILETEKGNRTVWASHEIKVRTNKL
jgi:hypothetical protein